eukprot:2763275-Prymnesium_polylepis.2
MQWSGCSFVFLGLLVDIIDKCVRRPGTTEAAGGVAGVGRARSDRFPDRRSLPPPMNGRYAGKKPAPAKPKEMTPAAEGKPKARTPKAD